MRGIKRISFAKFILYVLICAECIMAIFMIFFFHYFSDVIIDTEVKNYLFQESKEIIQSIEINENKIEYDWEDIYEETGIYTFVYYKDELYEEIDIKEDIGTILNQPNLRKMALGKSKTKDGHFYFIDLKNRKKYGKEYFIRFVINISNLSSSYITMIRVGYVAVFVILLMMTGAGIFVSRQVKNSFSKMNKELEKIGDNNISGERIIYQGPFYEMQLLCDADNRMIDRMEDHIKRQKQYISDVSHELRTPISVIMAQAEYGEKRNISPEEKNEILSVIKRQSKQMNELVMTLLELSRLDQEHSTIEKEEIDLGEIASFVCDGIIENSEEKIQVEYLLDKAQVKGNIHFISIAISNLFSNALKYSQEGSLITIKAGQTEKFSFVSVTDRGIGIEEEDQKHIFERFYKVDKSRSRKGYGLGLPLALKIAQVHGGNITVESEIGKGSTFTLYIEK